ncbi:MAG TPA: cytochrome c oxidase subunit 3 [Actinomycetota bacterium]|nr:cytochrome c oxidase subunit 3 [Actinomycetota bacterium]
MAVADTAALQERPAEDHHKPGGISYSLLGMVLFIASEVMFFGGLFGAYFTIRSAAPEWPPPDNPHLSAPYAAVLTAILVTSSVTMQFGVWAIRKNNQRRLILWLAVSLLLGAIFLAMQALEYANLIEEGMTLSSGVFGSTFYTLTGFHGAHVAGGAAFILIVLLRARSGQFTARYHDTVEMASYYWHFVDVVWIGLFSTIYLLQ